MCTVVRLTGSVSALVMVMCWCVLPTLGQGILDPDIADDAAAKYAASLAKTNRYLCAWEYAREVDEDDRLPEFWDVAGVFARDREKRIVRFATKGDYLNPWEKEKKYRAQRYLKTPENEFYQECFLEADSPHYVDLRKLEQGKFTKPHVFDPLMLPVAFWSILELDNDPEMGIESIFNLKDLITGVREPNTNCIVGWWWGRTAVTGEKFCIREYTFDPKQGGMPTRFRVWNIYKGENEEQARQLIQTAKPYQVTETKWIRGLDEIWFPTELDIRNQTGKSIRRSWTIKLSWIVDDVPDDVFTFEDVQLSEVGRSVVDKLISEAAKQKK